MEDVIRTTAGRRITAVLLVVVVLTLLAANLQPSWAAAPANDAFASAQVISAVPATISASNSEATLEEDEVQPTCSFMEASLWYRITPTQSGTISVDTFGSDHDTVLGVWSGTSPSLVEVACNDQAEPEPPGGESELSFSATAGKTYYIQAGAWWSPGNLTVNVTGPSITPPPTPTPTPTASAPASPSPTPTTSPSSTPSPAGSPSPSPSSSPSPSPSLSPSPTPSPSGTPDPEPDPSPGAGPITTTIHSKKKLVNLEERFMLYGRVIAGSACERPFEVFVRKLSSDGTGRSLGSVHTGPYGYWHMYVRSTISASYLADVTGTGTCYVTGPERFVQVGVRAKIKIAGHDRCHAREIHGRVSPAQPGTFVYLEQKSRGSWDDVSIDLLDGHSRFRLSAPRCGERYRVRWPAQSETNRSALHVFRLKG